MAKTASAMVSLSTRAPNFELLDTKSSEVRSLAELKGKYATVVMFICNHCPFVKHINNELVSIANDYQKRGVSFVAISSNDVQNYPDDSPENMSKVAEELGYPFPYLYDETQEVARAFGATCTPDFFVYNKTLELSYRGQLDDSRPGNGTSVTGKDLRMALDALLSDKEVLSEQKPSIGCGIKWKI